MSHAVYEDMLMKFVSLLFAAALTAHATAASPLPPPPVLPYAGPLRPVGTVSAFGASTLDDLAAVSYTHLDVYKRQLKTLRDNGTYNEIYKKWFGTEPK